MIAKQRPGSGDWSDWSLPLETVYSAAKEWEQQLQGVEKPWLCWNISPRWCLVQQNLVRSVGLTPVVGCDPRAAAPPLVDGAILIDFNEHFQFEEMWFHFPLEWTFLFAPRLAFWHSDLLCRYPVMLNLAETFNGLGDGEIAAVKQRTQWRDAFSLRTRRYWELAGCTTRAASRAQFEAGAGWWRNFALHPQCPDLNEKSKRGRYYYDHGVGVMYWKNHYKGIVRVIDASPLDEGHCTAIGNPRYVQMSAERTTSDKVVELDLNYNLQEVVTRLGISPFALP